MLLALILVPALGGLAAFALPSPAVRRAELVGAALAHGALTAACWVRPAPAEFGGWLALDGAGLLFLTITSVLFLATAIYAAGYLREETNTRRTDLEEGFLFDNAPEAVFVGCFLFFLAAMTLVTLSQHLGLLWVAVEATTLASAPLIYFHRHHRSLEATWKYLLICSVGIALALLANFFLGIASAQTAGAGSSLLLPDLIGRAGRLHTSWLKAACLLFFVGYGTKMGLAPLHTWLPDAHSEAPSVISALLSGAVLNCAFLGLLRMQQVCAAAGLEDFGRDVWIAFGIVSLVVAAVFILGQTDYKRMLAYSSVEHMGILGLGMGLGGAGVFGALLHAVNHSLAKAMLFLLSGNILSRYRSKSIAQVRGLLAVAPATGLLWVAGFLGISGLPPFGTFLSKFTILKAAFDGGHAWTGVLMLGFMAVIFIGMTTGFVSMAQGEPEKSMAGGRPDRWWQIVPPLALGLLLLWLGLAVPDFLTRLLGHIAATLGGSA